MHCIYGVVSKYTMHDKGTNSTEDRDWTHDEDEREHNVGYLDCRCNFHFELRGPKDDMVMVVVRPKSHWYVLVMEDGV